MHLELTDEQTKALIRELSEIIENDRYPLSPRIVALKETLGSYGRSPLARHRCPRDGITSRRARAGMHGDEVSVYPGGTDENTKIRKARTRTPTITAIRVHNQAAFRPIVELHHFDGPSIEGTPSLNTTSISIAVFSCCSCFLVVFGRSSMFYAGLCIETERRSVFWLRSYNRSSHSA